MNALRYASKYAFAARRFFSEAPVVKIVDDSVAKAASASESTKVVSSNTMKAAEMKPTETPKPAEAKPRVEKEQPKKKRSSFRPFLYGCVFTALVGYVFVYREIWKSAHQMEQSIADINVDVNENVDHLEQRVARLESNINELKNA